MEIGDFRGKGRGKRAKRGELVWPQRDNLPDELGTENIPIPRAKKNLSTSLLLVGCYFFRTRNGVGIVVSFWRCTCSCVHDRHTCVFVERVA